MTNRLRYVLRLLCLCATCAGALAGRAQAQQAPDSALTALVRDYTGLYARSSFDDWARLFTPGFTSAATNPDGTITIRSLAQFLDAQRRGFENAREMREELSNVRVEQQGRLANVRADFLFHYDGTPSRGKLMLLCVADTAGWKVHSLVFSYDH